MIDFPLMVLCAEPLTESPAGRPFKTLRRSPSCASNSFIRRTRGRAADGPPEWGPSRLTISGTDVAELGSAKMLFFVCNFSVRIHGRRLLRRSLDLEAEWVPHRSAGALEDEASGGRADLFLVLQRYHHWVRNSVRM